MNLRGADSGSLAQHAVRAVREHIRAHDLKVGDQLPGEGWFAAQLGVSRAVMREAFGALAALSLIDVGNGRRARVGAIDGSVMGASIDHAVTTSQISVADVWDVRRTVELRIAALAAERRSEAQAQHISHLAKMMASASDMEDTTGNDIAFHQAIADAAGNTLFNQIVRSFAPLMEIAVPRAWRTRVAQTDKQAILGIHLRIAQAIADRDPDAAAAAMEDHFVTSIGNLLREPEPRIES
jgi:GntR family transcriptional regulator, transcriptional repressor for pyruvate dehydrogenase complex